MGNGPLTTLKPRRSPRQGRSVATVDAIFEATVQVLSSDGLMRLTTTRVARRAGVSVGTLYQYFPNKQALLFAVMEQHLAILADVIEEACDEVRGTTLETIAEAVVKAYLHAKMAQAEISPALYRIAMELDARALIEAAIRRNAQAIATALSAASDGRLADPGLVAHTLTAALYGTVPAFCHKVLSPADGSEAKRQLTVMFRSYLLAAERQGGIDAG